MNEIPHDIKPNAPTEQNERIESLDVIRGFAVLGILLMNIQSFSMIGATYLNPTAIEGHQGTNYFVWYFCHLLADSKFMSIFSMLFGAGVVLMARRQEKKGQAVWALHYRRMLGLLIIGLVHAYGFWYGDILVPYAVCGSLVIFLWRLPVRWLVAASVFLILIGAALTALFGVAMLFLSESELAEVTASWRPSGDLVREELSAYRGDWMTQLRHRAESSLVMQGFLLPTMIGWHVAGLMLLGMALFKAGFLSGDRSKPELAGLAIVGMVVGLPLIAWGIHWNESSGWSLKQSLFFGMLPNYFGSTFVALSYICGIGLLLKSRLRTLITAALAPVGRMALTNYLMQTLICTTIFYGHGFAMFGRVDRLQQLGIVAGVWVFQIIFSKWWMSRFRIGPLEYLWRTATYSSLRPIRR